MTNADLLFVYGTLRPGHGGPMAQWLIRHADHREPCWAAGRLYRVADYPGFVPGSDGRVAGDLFALPNDPTLLAALDEHEECSDRFPEPHEYRRERLIVQGRDGPVEAWVYVYSLDVAGLEHIAHGDFLCAGESDR